MKFFRLPPLACAFSLMLAALLAAVPSSAQQEYETLPAQVQPNQAQPTYVETRISAMEEQMRALNGRVEQIEFAVRRLDQSVQRMQSDNDARLTRLEQQTAAMAAAATAASVAQPIAQPISQPPQQPGVPLSQSNLQQQPATDVIANGTLGAIKLQDGRVTGAVNAPQSTPLPQVPPDYGLTSQEQYDRAFDMLRQANYADAESAFKNFIEKNPKDKLIDNAKYWYGETLYVRARFDESAVAFADAYQTNPNGSKAPDSLLKLSMSLGALNKTSDACVTLGELKSKYPNASTTIKARAAEQRTRLKCPAR
jgi:tol-pal system protein YbgF